MRRAQGRIDVDSRSCAKRSYTRDTVSRVYERVGLPAAPGEGGRERHQLVREGPDDALERAGITRPRGADKAIPERLYACHGKRHAA